MGFQRSHLSALAFFLLRSASALAVLDVDFQDLVALIQHTVAGPRPEQLSLLAVDESSRWYETSTEDDELVQKLADKKQALEAQEKELEELANATNATAEALFSEKGSSVKLTLEKAHEGHELSEEDYDHLVEDEQILEDLAAELQRIAAEVEVIAQHQLDFGKRLDLPDPTVDEFEIDDNVEVQISEGKHIGKWVKATIIGHGARTNTYRVHVPSAKKGSQDLDLVGAKSLRKDEEAVRGWNFEAVIVTFNAGEQAQIKLSAGATETWAKCVVRSNGTEPDTYNVHVGTAAQGHKDMYDVPAKFLRKVDAKMLFGQYDLDGDGELSTQEFHLALKEKATNVKAHDAAQNGTEDKALFATGESAEVTEFDVVNSSYVSCMVMGEGDLSDSYNVFVPSYPVGFQFMPNIPVDRLRKVGERKDAEEQKIKLIPSFMDYEVIAPRGSYKGKWVPCQLKRRNPGDTYDVWIPFGVLKGHNLATGIPGDKLRVRKTCGPGYDDIFDGDYYGTDAFGRLKNMRETVEDCAADCNKRMECLSFEYVARTKECNLNRAFNPTLPAPDDQMFCRRKEQPKAPPSLWEGPLVGQPLEYIMTISNHAGEWHPCTVLNFGSKPDTYTVNASIEFLNITGKSFVNLSEVPIKYLRYALDRPVEAVSGKWTPPEGEAALWVNNTETASNETEEKYQNFLVSNFHLNSTERGLDFRSRKDLNSTIGTGATALWGSYVYGVDEGTGWVRVGNAYLPTFIRGVPVLMPRVNGELGELVQVRRNNGLWAYATIRSRGDEPNTYNVRMLKGKTGKYMDNVPVSKMRKDISAPKVAVVTTTTALPVRKVTTTAKRVEVVTTTLPLPVEVVVTTSAAPVAQESFNSAVENYVEKLRQEGRERRMKEQKQNASEVVTIIKEFQIDNRMLKHKGPGLSYRQSKRLDDSRGKQDLAYWGTTIRGINEGDGWIRVGDKYLPTEVKGIPVITQKVTGDLGEIVQYEQEDGTWSHATVRSKGDWENTFNLHVMDNGAGYELDNVAAARVRHDLDAVVIVRATPLLGDAGSESSEEDNELLSNGDLGEDLPEGVFRPNMTAEVKINAGPQAGKWVKCLVVDVGNITETYNLYVPSAPSEYRTMWNIPVLAIRKLSSSAAPAAQSAPGNTTAVDRDGIDGEVGESVEVMVHNGDYSGGWLPAIIVAEGAKPDSYDIRMPGMYGSHKDIAAVPGRFLRRSDIKVVIQEEPEYPTFEPGERAQVVVAFGADKKNRTYNCTVVAKGDFSNTYDVFVPGSGNSPGVHAKFMKKLADGIVTTVTTTSTSSTTEPTVLSFPTFLWFVEQVKADFSPVFATLLSSKKQLKAWEMRSEDWSASCSADDHIGMAAKIRKMAQAPKEAVLRSVPRECRMASWYDHSSGDVSWDKLGECLQRSANVSESCAFCGVKLAMNVAEGCLSKCQPMLSACVSADAVKTCPPRVSRCAECLEKPAESFMKCSMMPGRTELMAALGRVARPSKEEVVNVESAMRKELSPSTWLETDSLVRSTIKVLLSSLQAVAPEKPKEPKE